MKYYAGVGSRNTPFIILELMTRVASKLEKEGYVLRSGGADGADAAFEKGITEHKEIYLPWKFFNKNTSSLYSVTDDAMLLASEHHPAWSHLKRPVKLLMGRNTYQVLGLDLNTPIEFVLCWTPDGCTSAKTRTSKTGGTGLAIALADSRGIPVYNLADEETFLRFSKMVT